MCRSSAEGGRRCHGSRAGSSGGLPAGDDSGQESHQGTPWQGYDEYIQRSDELDRRVAAGESVTDIMRAEQLRRGEERIAQITREGW